MRYFLLRSQKISGEGAQPFSDPSPSGRRNIEMKNDNKYNFRCKNSMQNAPKRAPFSTQKLKHFLGGARPPPETPPLVGRENTEIKHNNQYNLRLLWCAKIPPRMHQNAPFSVQKSKNSGRSLLLWKENPLPHLPLTRYDVYTGPSL